MRWWRRRRQAHLKEVLAQVATYHVRGPQYGLYELNAEFRGGLSTDG
jgi:hypothetical protein